MRAQRRLRSEARAGTASLLDAAAETLRPLSTRAPGCRSAAPRSAAPQPVGSSIASIASTCALTWCCGRAESLDSDWSHSSDGSETLSTSSDFLTDFASADAREGQVKAGAAGGSPNCTPPAQTAHAQGRTAAPMHRDAPDGPAATEDGTQTEREASAMAGPLASRHDGRALAAAPGLREERRQRERIDKGEVAISMERFAVVAALRKFAAGRPWLEKVVTDSACNLESLNALHEDILFLERSRILGVDDVGCRDGDGGEEVPGFVPSAEYLGVREGMMFREGMKGLGYYPMARGAGEQGGTGQVMTGVDSDDLRERRAEEGGEGGARGCVLEGVLGGRKIWEVIYFKCSYFRIMFRNVIFFCLHVQILQRFKDMAGQYRLWGQREERVPKWRVALKKQKKGELSWMGREGQRW